MKFYIVPEDELMHYGVKGMRRGVRKYTNPDGTLTAAGKARYFRARRAQGKTLNRVGTGTSSGMQRAQDVARHTRNSLRKDRIRTGPAGRGYQGVTKQIEWSAKQQKPKHTRTKVEEQAGNAAFQTKAKVHAMHWAGQEYEARSKRNLARKTMHKTDKWGKKRR